MADWRSIVHAVGLSVHPQMGIYLLGVVNSVATTICVHVLVRVSVFYSFVDIPTKCGIVGVSMGILLFTF